jgi:hypothetical protein
LRVALARPDHKSRKSQAQTALCANFSQEQGRLIERADENHLAETKLGTFRKAKKLRIIRSEINHAEVAEGKLQARENGKDLVDVPAFAKMLQLFRLAAAIIAGREFADLEFSKANPTMCFLHNG